MARERPPRGRDDALTALGALGDPTRRAIYEHVVKQAGWVGRDEAAAAVDIGRGAAAHHLDRLADAGLLETTRMRLNQRTGPGAGRPAKVYRRASGELSASLPSRDYRYVGELLAEALERTIHGDGTAAGNAAAVAAEAGAELRGRIAQRIGSRKGARHRRSALLEELEAAGFEPRVEDGVVVLGNCPFDRLARQHTELVCGMNLCLFQAVVENSMDDLLVPELVPHDDRCCVRLVPPEAS